MATYKSEEVALTRQAEEIWHKLSNLENLRGLIGRVPRESIPDDKREMLEKIEITPDTITVPGGPVGAVVLRMSEKEEPTLIKLKGEGTPVEMSVAMHIRPTGTESCEAQVVIDLAIPALLKPMVNGPLTQMAQQLGQVVRALQFA